jgi:hypothetical protein
MGEPKSRKTMKEVKERATKLYNDWKEGTLRHTIEQIHKLQDIDDWNERDKHMAMQLEANIERLHKSVVKKISEIKGIPESQVKTRPLDFPSGSSDDDQKHWCIYAIRAAFETERFHSHVMKKNPHPKKTEGWSEEKYEADHRDKRTVLEQAWLQEQDLLFRMEKRKRARGLKKARAKAEGGMHHKTPKKHKQHGHKHPSGAQQIPSFPEPQASRPAAKSAIVPYERASSRAAPKVATRLPAFPKFPAYARK